MSEHLSAMNEQNSDLEVMIHKLNESLEKINSVSNN